MTGLFRFLIEPKFNHLPKGTQITLRAIADKEARAILGKNCRLDDYRYLCSAIINCYLVKQPITIHFPERSITLLPQNYYKRRSK